MHVSIKRVTKRCPVLSCSVMFDFLRLMDYSPQGASVHGILQARIMEWFPFPSPRNLPDPGTEPESPVLQANLYHPSHQGSPATQNALPSGQQCGHTRKQPCSSQNIQVRVAGRWTVTVTVVSCKKMLYSSPCRRS